MARHCPGGVALTDVEAVDILTMEGDADAAESYRHWYGRKMCSVCHGAVLRKADDTLRRHVPRSNRS